VAGWLSLSALWVPREFAGEDGIAAVSRVSASKLGDGRHDLSGHPHFSAIVVSSHMVADHPEERGERVGTATSAGTEKV